MRFEETCPHNDEAEGGVLGAMLLDNDTIDEVFALIRPEDFYHPLHVTVASEIRAMRDANVPVDAISLIDWLSSRDLYQAPHATSRDFKWRVDDELIGKILEIPHAANAAYHAEIILGHAKRRALILAGSEAVKDARGGWLTADEAISAAERRIMEIGQGDLTRSTVHISEALRETMERVDRQAMGDEAISGFPTGLFDLDSHLAGGLKPRKLYILAARPAMGKTALALNISEAISGIQNVPILFFSVEMGREELSERLLSGNAQIDGRAIQLPKSLGPDRLDRLAEAFRRLSDHPIYVNDATGMTVSRLASEARRQRAKHGIGMVVVDYIQLLEADAGEQRSSRQEQVSTISRRLKTLSRELDCPVLALSQLNRKVEDRDSKRPRMSDLRESGAIEQDADVIMLLHRPEEYDPKDQPGIAEVIIAKNRAGATGMIRLKFEKAQTRFGNYVPDQFAPSSAGGDSATDDEISNW